MSKNLLNFFLAVASFAMYYVVINPLYTGIGPVWQPEKGVASLRDTNNQYDAALTQVNTLAKQADTLRAQYGSISPDVKQKMETMVPSSVDPIRLLSEVNYIANQSGMVIRDLGYSENLASTGPLGSYVVSFSVNTSYDKFKELMRNYETSLRLFTIKSVGFSSPVKDGDTINFQVRLETFYMK